MVEMESEEFKKKYPNLWREIMGEDSSSGPTTTEAHQDMFRGYIPTAVDYIRRCKTSEQAEETISYLEKTEQVTAEYAQRLRVQLRIRGLRSFGPRKKEGHYLREAGLV
ncbi:DUF2095 family protein [Candidatus Bathyarchaeota archaeon]|nr:DUF2095 family protein [Candidatus Bathyarchaeota archaeon]